MNIETYDKIIDGTITAVVMLLWSAFIVGVINGIAVGTSYAITEDVNDFYWVLAFTIPLTVIGIFFHLSFMATKGKYGSQPWRNFWMIFGHEVELEQKNSKETRNEIEKWACSNQIGFYRRVWSHNKPHKYVFLSKKDAVEL